MWLSYVSAPLPEQYTQQYSGWAMTAAAGMGLPEHYRLQLEGYAIGFRVQGGAGGPTISYAYCLVHTSAFHTSYLAVGPCTLPQMALSPWSPPTASPTLHVFTLYLSQAGPFILLSTGALALASACCLVHPPPLPTS